MKATTLRLAMFMLLLSLFGGCVSIKSVTDPNFKKHISRAFVQIRTSESASGFSKDLQRELVKGFERYGIDCRVHDRSALSLEGASDIKKKMEEYNPDVIIIISQTEQKYYNGATSGGEFELSMYEPNSDKPVWKAVLSSDTSGLGMGGATTVAGKILSKLEEDKLIVLPVQK